MIHNVQGCHNESKINCYFSFVFTILTPIMLEGFELSFCDWESDESEFEFAVPKSVENRDSGRIGGVARTMVFVWAGVCKRLWFVSDGGIRGGGLGGRDGWRVIVDEEEEESVVGGLGFVLSICRSLASINAILSFVLHVDILLSILSVVGLPASIMPLLCFPAFP
jgi:hypothetical protein